MKARIIDSSSGSEIAGKIGRFTTVTMFVRDGQPVDGVFESVRPGDASGRGKRALVKALKLADEKNAESDRSSDRKETVVLYQPATKIWWPCELSTE